MRNVLKSNEWQRIWVHKTFKIAMQKGGPNNSDFLQNWLPPEISSPLFNLQKFQKSEKGSSESFGMNWNLMNGKKFGSLKLSKFKCRTGYQLIQIFCRIGSPQKLGLISLICNFKTLRKGILNYAECIDI